MSANFLSFKKQHLQAVSALSILIGSAATMPAAAQSLAGVNEDTSLLEVITVSARRRVELLTDVPLAIVAFDESQINSLVITDITDLAELTPGFAMQNNSRQNEQPFIRGFSVGSFFRDNQTASFFHDGVFVGGVARTIGLDDVEQVEVLFGPQAVYFGRQTFAGAVNYISKKPTFDFQAHGRVEYGENARFGVSGGVSGPIVEDKLAFRVYAGYGSYDGEFQNTLTLDRVQTEETFRVAGSLTWRPWEGAEIRARVQHAELDDGHNASVLLPASNNNSLPDRDSGVNQFFTGELPIPSQIALNLDTLEFMGGRRLTNQERYSLFGDFEIGDMTLSLITAYNEDFNINSADGDGLPAATFFGNFTFTSDYWDFTQQAVLTSSQEERLRWLVGGIYFESERVESSLTFPFTSLSDPRKVQNFGIFAAVEYDFTDALTLTVEGRFNHDDVTREERDEGGVDLNQTFSKFLPRVVLDYKLSDDTLLYALVSRGNQPGDFNTTAGIPEEFVIVEEQTMWNFEIGAKHTYFDGAGQINFTAYYIDWNGQVIPTLQETPDAPTPTSVIDTNAGGSRSIGFEVENNNQWNEQFSTRITYSYNNAEFTDFLTDRLDDVNPAGQPLTDVSGNRLQNSPRHNFTFAADYTDELPGFAGWSWFARGNYSYRSRQFTSELNTAFIDGLNLVNASIGLEAENVTLTLYGRNLLSDDTPAFATIFSDFTSFTPSYLLTLRENASYGIRADFRF
ncbi:MAG: TonB-dependent receptor [Pseudomonadota bacterium]